MPYPMPFALCPLPLLLFYPVALLFQKSDNAARPNQVAGADDDNNIFVFYHHLFNFFNPL